MDVDVDGLDRRRPDKLYEVAELRDVLPITAVHGDMLETILVEDVLEVP